MTRRLVPILAVLTIATGMLGAGVGSGASVAKDPPGKTLFMSNCAGCHTLAAAKAKGTVGPNLDKKKTKLAIVVARVTNGKGAMPSFKGRLKTTQITQIAKWVTANYKK
ncbi:MAG: c-type cytochrome [Actinobacteria bacterium]|nr:c-type cytochrome [Actinomycetota bacterium]